MFFLHLFKRKRYFLFILYTTHDRILISKWFIFNVLCLYSHDQFCGSIFILLPFKSWSFFKQQQKHDKTNSFKKNRYKIGMKFLQKFSLKTFFSPRSHPKKNLMKKECTHTKMLQTFDSIWNKKNRRFKHVCARSCYLMVCCW